MIAGIAAGLAAGVAAGTALALLSWVHDTRVDDAYTRGLKAGQRARWRRQEAHNYRRGYRAGLGQPRCSGLKEYRINRKGEEQR